jgi:hypothetical protein
MTDREHGPRFRRAELQLGHSRFVLIAGFSFSP